MKNNKKLNSPYQNYREYFRDPGVYSGLRRHGIDFKDGIISIGGIPFSSLISNFGLTFSFTNLPIISQRITNIQNHFEQAIKKYGYGGKYKYLYCTKSNHFRSVIEQVIQHSNIGMESSSSIDIKIFQALIQSGDITHDIPLVNNGYKNIDYLEGIGQLYESGVNNICILDSVDELDKLLRLTKEKIKIGIRLATYEGGSKSRLGIPHNHAIEFLKDNVLGSDNTELTMLHFFMNSGLSDTEKYFIELEKMVVSYCRFKAIFPSLSDLNIGGGLKISYELETEIKYGEIIDSILSVVQSVCQKYGIQEPNIYTEFGTYTVGEGSGSVFSVIGIKEGERPQYIFEGSFLNEFPDMKIIGITPLVIPITHLDREIQLVDLGGMTCDSDDVIKSVYMPKIKQGESLEFVLLNTGCYQHNLSGFGGLNHCQIPHSKRLEITEGGEVKLTHETQKHEQILEILGWKEKTITI